jgi:hypothetical protein
VATIAGQQTRGCVWYWKRIVIAGFVAVRWLDEAASRRWKGAFRLRMIGRFSDLFRLVFR